MHESLSTQQARKLVLLSQRLPPKKQIGDAKAATLSAVEHLGYIQIDAISVINRAHHHTIWNRNPRYQSEQLDQLVAEKSVFEYWSHAASYLPMRDYRFSLPRKQALASGAQDHWWDRDEQMIKFVLKRITAEGPLMAKDFEYTGKKTSEWKTKPAKRALEYLFMQGDLMAPYRNNFHKVYDLTERVIPEGTNTSVPSAEEHARFLITQYLRANGLGQASEISYLVKGVKLGVISMMKEMDSNGELIRVHSANQVYYTLPESLALLNTPLARSKLKILSPFDNLLIQRKRMRELFDFDYLIECYLPEAKRKFGYFSLPILWNGMLVARMDCKAERSESVLHIHHLALEPTVSNIDTFLSALCKELESFIKFNMCKNIRLHRTSPAKLKAPLTNLLRDMRK